MRRTTILSVLAFTSFATTEGPAAQRALVDDGRIRLGAHGTGVRVGPDGLVWTCRDAVLETLGPILHHRDLADGFVAASPDRERRLPGCVAQRRIAVRDVTEQLTAPLGDVVDAERAAALLSAARAELVASLTAGLPPDHTVRVQPIADGARFFAETWQSFADVRLVAIPAGIVSSDDPNAVDRPEPDFVLLRLWQHDGPLRATSGRPVGIGEWDEPAVLLAPPPEPLRPWTPQLIRFHRDLLLPRQLAGIDEAITQIHDRWQRLPAQAAALAMRRLERDRAAAVHSAWSSASIEARRAVIACDTTAPDAIAALDEAFTALTAFAADGGAEAERHALQRRLPELLRRVAAELDPPRPAESTVIAIPDNPPDPDAPQSVECAALRGAAAIAAEVGSPVLDAAGRVVAVVTHRDHTARVAALAGHAAPPATASICSAAAMLRFLRTAGAERLAAGLTADVMGQDR